MEFAIHQLVEVALRAIPTGINNPFTAMTCVDWLGVAFCPLAEQQIPSPDCYDAQGKLSVMTNPVTFAGIADTACNLDRAEGVPEAQDQKTIEARSKHRNGTISSSSGQARQHSLLAWDQ